MSLPITPTSPAPLVDLGYGPTDHTPTAVASDGPWNIDVPAIASPSAARALKVSPFEYAPYVEHLWPHPTPELTLQAQAYMAIYCAVHATSLPNYLGAKIPIPSQMNLEAWDTALEGYHDAQVATFLRFGWPGSYTAPSPPTPSVSNHPSATNFAKDLDSFLEKEVRLGAMLGPFDAPPFSDWYQTSQLMTVEKKDSDKRRVIIDLSYPAGEAVNDGVLKNHFQGEPLTYKLPTITDLSDRIAAMAPGSTTRSALLSLSRPSRRISA